jgi:hypothetical protein
MRLLPVRSAGYSRVIPAVVIDYWDCAERESGNNGTVLNECVGLLIFDATLLL